MKKNIFLLLIFIFTKFVFTKQIFKCCKTNLYNHVLFLTSITPSRNFRNIKSLNIAAKYIKNNFKKYSPHVSTQVFSVYGKKYKNIITSYGKTNAPRIIVGAHYDVCGNQPGADDNGSGVAGLLELARLIAKNKPKLKYRIDFVAYSLEEPPFFGTNYMGSAVHAKFLREKNIKVKLMIVLEMIGFYTDKKKSQNYPLGLLGLFYPNVGNYVAVTGRFSDRKYIEIVKKSIKKNTSVKVVSLAAPSIVKGIDFSDHRNYWKYNYNAIMITDTAFYRNENYHKKTDTIATLNFAKMAEVVKGIYYSILTL